MTPNDKEFVYQLTDYQDRLFGYLVTLLGNLHDARDVLQETNLVLVQKAQEYDEGTNFGAWAHKCAYFQALAFLRDKKRDRHMFDNELLALFEAEESGSALDEAYQLALRDCLTQLPERQRNLIHRRYSEEHSVKELAEFSGKKQSAIKMTLMRVRQALLECIELKLAEAAL